MNLFTEECDFLTSNRAANIKMLRKVADGLGKTEFLYSSKGKEGIWSATENTIGKIAKQKAGGERWKFKEDAKKLFMDERVYSGEYLIKINGEAFRYLKDNYEKLMKAEIIKHGNKESKNMINELMLKLPPSEELLWYFILNADLDVKDDNELKRWRETERLMWHDLENEIKTESFQDAQFWLFWNYLRKL